MTGKERKGDNQKLKMLYLTRIFSEETDDQHALTMQQIIKKLSSCGVNADRKTLYLDFEELRRFGLDIIAVKEGRSCFYHLGNRDFELPELKLLVDSVQSAKFITDRKSKELIRKLEALVSKYEGKQLQRQVFIAGRIKSMNESIYYNVDQLHEAISADCQIRFKYYQWNVAKKMELRKNGAWYQLSPWGLMWDDENYYLVGYDSEDDKIKHYRVDKISNIKITDRPREGKEEFRNFDPAAYSKKNFGMFSGEEVKVHIQFPESFVGIFFDRFGKDITVHKTKKEGFYETVVGVAISEQFFGWVTALGPQVTITGPERVVDEYKKELKAILKNY